ncbi:hypothetical protein [Legionella cincinnatiensis]|uniref:Uncharacterized protein n=1 Tax=Legionella cincinnatiensis TaxID=28085 RepID=A0A378ILE0_9GAMM|nr:hypothetical protein [Legionella cincinnatiensis]KTC88552.1 hypothetical protein Lcin_1429 [Legionella cincinnatiensis]STX35959.1 Uncharacterised protein [Legionella cincinnatiensis]
MKFGIKDLINATDICDSVTNTIDLTYTNIPMYKATIQYAEHVLKGLPQDIEEEQVSKLKNAIRQLKSDLYLYFRSELKNAPREVKSDLDKFFQSESQQHLKNYVKEHAKEIIKNEQEIQQKSVLSTLGIFTKFNKNDINTDITETQSLSN